MLENNKITPEPQNPGKALRVWFQHRISHEVAIKDALVTDKWH
jgi:hypothetical protein